ncbi:MAG TPA: nucleotide exchange factor GrpE [Chloroflexi bacterium]|nr:nucleotide exchange factor GrpE [Chloroflexota bacterium]
MDENVRVPVRATTAATGDASSKSESAIPEAVEAESVAEWRDRAQRLQAEMENFRKRQRRWAEERVAEERERLLRTFLQVDDDLQRALSADVTSLEDLRQGVRLTRQTLRQILAQEGVELVEAEGQPFDTRWHQAVGSVSHRVAGVAPDTVAHVAQPGYRIGERLLRPARVIVAI